MNISIRIVSALFFLSCIGTAQAFSTDQYQIEIIIFSHLDKQSLNSEVWPVTNTTISAPPNALFLNLGDDAQGTSSANIKQATQPLIIAYEHQQQPITLLPKTSYQLNDSAIHINRSKHFKVMAHLAWIQDFSSKMPPLYLYTTDDTTDTTTLSGLINIDRQHFFHTNYQLLLSVPNQSMQHMLNHNNIANNEAGRSYFTLDQSRRMRSNELNYIDSPVMGLLIEFFPILNKDNAHT